MNPRDRFAAAARAAAPRFALDTASNSLYIYGAIGSYWGDIAASEVVPAIRSLDSSAELTVYVNSPGGDVYEGVAIRNAIAQHPGHVRAVVDGLAASAASFILTGANEVVMGDHAEVMIHDAWSVGMGNADDLRAVADDLDRLSDSIAQMYAAHAGGDFTEWRDRMKAETWYTATAAVDAGLAHSIDSRSDSPSTINYAAAFARKDTPMDPIIETPAPLIPAAPVAIATPPAGEAVAPEIAAGPQNATGPHQTSVIERPRAFAQVYAAIQEPIKKGDLRGALLEFNNLLAEIGTDIDGGDAFFRPEWLGEIWQARTGGRPWIESLGGAKALTATKLEGFRWARPDEYTAEESEGRVKPYAGNFAEVPTGKRKTIKIEEDTERWGFGTKIDRIFQDLGSPDLAASLFSLLAADFDADSDAHVRTKILDAATAGAAQTSLVRGLTRMALDLKKIGATLSQVWLAEDVFEDFAELTVADLPAWLANQIGFVDLTDGTATVSSKLRADVDFGLPAGQLVGYDKRAAEVRQTPLIRLESIDISHGATDLGLFGYGGTLITDARAIRKYTITAPAEAAAMFVAPEDDTTV